MLPSRFGVIRRFPSKSLDFRSSRTRQAEEIEECFYLHEGNVALTKSCPFFPNHSRRRFHFWSMLCLRLRSFIATQIDPYAYLHFDFMPRSSLESVSSMFCPRLPCHFVVSSCLVHFISLPKPSSCLGMFAAWDGSSSSPWAFCHTWRSPADYHGTWRPDISVSTRSNTSSESRQHSTDKRVRFAFTSTSTGVRSLRDVMHFYSYRQARQGNRMPDVPPSKRICKIEPSQNGNRRHLSLIHI